MRHYTALIDILYNPARYCDNSWLNAPEYTAESLTGLPAYLKNHFILARLAALPVPESEADDNRTLTLFIRHWDKIPRAAFMLGLKLFSPHILKNPRFMQRLSPLERAFLCLPLPFFGATDRYLDAELSNDNITQAGAICIYALAAGSLPPIVLERLKLIFPSSLSFTTAPCENVHSSLSALKWAFDYA